MNNLRFLLLVMVVLLVGAGLAGCGTKKGEATQTPTSTLTPSGTTTTNTTPSAGGLAWPDIPIYPSLRQIQKASQPLPQTGYAKADFRFYETNDSLEKVVAFYKGQMPAKGWGETPWTDTPQFSMGMYTKNSEEHLAWVWVFSGGGKTELILGRALKE